MPDSQSVTYLGETRGIVPATPPSRQPDLDELFEDVERQAKINRHRAARSRGRVVFFSQTDASQGFSERGESRDLSKSQCSGGTNSVKRKDVSRKLASLAESVELTKDRLWALEAVVDAVSKSWDEQDCICQCCPVHAGLQGGELGSPLRFASAAASSGGRAPSTGEMSLKCMSTGEVHKASGKRRRKLSG